MDPDPDLEQETSPSLPGHSPEIGPLPHVAASYIAHVAFLALAAFAVPASDPAADDAPVDAELQAMMVILHEATAERDEDPAREIAETIPDDRAPSDSRCGGEKNGGSMGAAEASPTRLRYGVQGPADNPDPHIAREQYSPDPSIPIGWSWLSIGRATGDRAAPLAPWGREEAIGTDPVSARGRMWGDDTGDARGSPGLGNGRRTICLYCGDSGAGARVLLATLAAGATGTEAAGAIGVVSREER